MKITKLKLEDELHHKFKSTTAARGSNMQETMVKLIKEYLLLKESKEDKHT